ncbi:MAG TPA: sterol desaturase family protein [Flavisolibacter sp.]|nr:sterol desaturase family protein [Flavisolibacter sp.]
MEKLQALLAINQNYLIAGLLLLLYVLEQTLNTPFRFRKRPQHLLNNVLFQITFMVAGYFFALYQVTTIEWLNHHRVGWLHVLHLPFWIRMMVGVALFDLTTYWVHRLAHRSPLLWRLHRVHHSDTTMDASTFFRGHPLEILVFGNGNIVAAAVFGLDMLSLGLYALVLIPFMLAEHMNLAFPTWLDKTLGRVFVTPNFHKVHHEQDQYYTDSNFADIFIVWDRLFGTFKYKPVQDIRYGLIEFAEEKKQGFLYLMKCPFITIPRISSEEPHQAARPGETRVVFQEPQPETKEADHR